MEQRLKPEVFYGSAIAALTGLLFGLVLHAPWQKHPGGPQILFNTAQAAEPVHTAVKGDEANGAPAPTEVADLDASYVTPDPLPVIRLHPEMFDVQPAAADEAERQAVGDVVADDTPQTPPRDLD